LKRHRTDKEIRLRKNTGNWPFPKPQRFSMGKKQDIHFGCVIEKQLMLFSLKFQRDNRQNALTVDPAKGKTGEKGCIFNALWR